MTGRGFFLSLDGPDGGGKSTQAARLIEWLRGGGYTVVACRDPGGTGLGDRLRELLLERHQIAITMPAEMLLYMASRAQLVAEVIGPALEAGSIVVCDRYLLANVVYQGYAGGLCVEDLWEVGRIATGGLMPDLTIVIDIAEEVARERVASPRDRMEDRPAEFRKAVREGFLQAAKSYEAPIVVVDGGADVQAVSRVIQEEVSRALGSCSRP